MSDIAIVGAGPAGSLLAHGLARGGRAVIVLDHRAPWEKPCGGMLGPTTLEKTPILASYPYSLSECKGIRYISPRSEQKFVSANQRLFVISRLELGKFLIDQARAVGAQFIRENVVNVSRNNSRWLIETSHNFYQADLIVGADGAASVVRKRVLGNIPKQHLSMACGYFLTGIPSEQYVIKFLDVEGYLWVFSRADHASAGIGARLGTVSGKQLFERMDRFLEEYYPGAIRVKRWAAMIPTAQDASMYDQPGCGDNWVLVGDAAGHVDPATGEGMYYALQSAQLACQSILNDDLPSYERNWRDQYGHILIERAALMQKLSKLGKLFGPSVVGGLMYNYNTRAAR